MLERSGASVNLFVDMHTKKGKIKGINVLHTGPEQVNAKHAVGKEQGDGQSAHVLGLKQVEWQQGLLGHPAFHVNGSSQKQHADDEGDNDIRRLPALRSMATVGKGKGNQHQGGHNGGNAPPVHDNLDALGLVLFQRALSVVGDGQETSDAEDDDDDGSQPEVPPPAHELTRDTADDDANEETNGSEGRIETKYQILSRSGAVRLAQDHDGGRHEGGRAQSGQGTAGNEHLVVVREAGDQGPGAKPDETEAKDKVGAVHVG